MDSSAKFFANGYETGKEEMLPANIGRTSRRGEGGKRLMQKQTTIRLPEELKEQLQREADRKRISFNALIIIYCQKGLSAQ